MALNRPRWEVWSDASGKGYGGHLGPQSKPLDVWQDSHPHIASGKGSTEYVEALAVLLSLRRWKERLKGQKVFFYVDNYQVYKVLAKRYTPVKQLSLPFPLSLSLAATVSGQQRHTQHQVQQQQQQQQKPSHEMPLSSIPATSPLSPTLSSPHSSPHTCPPGTETYTDPRSEVPSVATPIAKQDKGYFTSNPRCAKTQATFDEIDSIIRTYQIELRARWVWGKDNFLADTLSRISKLPSPSVGTSPASTSASDDKGYTNARIHRSSKLTPHVLELLEASRKAEVENGEGALQVDLGSLRAEGGPQSAKSL
ncbi:hypothetical protein I317_02574 [Kwoniella heveanensis CBS 569]|nr:hypothetical protein I317_02574 [Kwoniella heveanensis CBS 569]